MKRVNCYVSGLCAVVVCLLGSTTVVFAAVHVLTVTDPITPVTADYLASAIDAAQAADAVAVVIELDTPGGLDLAMRDIIKKIMISPVPVIVYVAPSGARAASAGALITLAAHIAAMAPGTNIGAAHPVSIGPGNMDETMSAKVENDAAAYVRSIAEKRGRNADWAVRAVRESISADASQALDANVIDFIAADLPDLLQRADGLTVQTSAGLATLALADAKIEYHRMGLRYRILTALANPTIAYILFLAGLAGLYFEFTNPGALFPGIVGGVCLILALYAMQSLSANFAGILLVLVGMVLLILEIKVTSYGLLSIGGIIALLLGSLMLFDPNGPEFLRLSLSTILPAVAAFAAFFICCVVLVVRAQRRRPRSVIDGLLQEGGVARSDLDPNGKVFIHGELWNATADQPIARGTDVQVTAVDGMLLHVTPASTEITACSGRDGS